MAKPARSPVLGYNHNVRYQGHIFHVQTEDSGPGNPRVFTHLFFEGSILASKRCDYDAETAEDNVRGLMQGQHKAILKDLKQGTFDERIARFFDMRIQASKADVAPAVDACQVPALGEDSAEPTAEQSPLVLAEEPIAVKAHAWGGPPAGGEVAIAQKEAGRAPVWPQTETTADTPPTESSVEPSLPNAPGQPELPADAAVLDLDAAATAPVERAATPEPLPIHATQPAMPGPGTYTLRRAVREHPPETSPKPRSVPTADRPVTPVVVQRQVIVAAGGEPVTAPRKPSTTPVRRRPVSAGPYVVKEGSHADIVVATGSRKAGQPAPGPDGEAPRTVEPPRPSQEAAPSVLVTDQSLDDVILAYLSQGERKG